MKFSETLSKKKSILVVLDEKQYEKELENIIKSLEKTRSKICYVCLNKPYEDVLENLKKMGIKTEKFFFIDVLSSHYFSKKSTDKCIYVSAPSALDEIHESIRKMMKKSCCAVLFDTISTLLIYHRPDSIVRFTNNLFYKKERNKHKIIHILVYVGHILKKEREELIEDLEMFVEKTLEPGKRKNYLTN